MLIRDNRSEKMKEQYTLKETRILQNLTQEELASAAGISIRTIQRIEKGETIGSPHTIRTLAKTLNIESGTFKPSEKIKLTETKDIYAKVKLQNFSILSVIFIPFGNIIFPTLVFFRHRKDKQISTLGKKILNFQILSTLFCFIITVVIFQSVGRGPGAIPIPVFICYPLYILVSLSTVIYTSLHMNTENKLLNLFPNILS